MDKRYKITVFLSGRTNNFSNQNADGSYTFAPLGNARTTEKSAIAAVKRICALGGCKVESIKAVEKNEANL